MAGTMHRIGQWGIVPYYFNVMTLLSAMIYTAILCSYDIYRSINRSLLVGAAKIS